MFDVNALVGSLTLMLQGMVGIFIVVGVIVLIVSLLNSVFKNKA